MLRVEAIGQESFDFVCSNLWCVHKLNGSLPLNFFFRQIQSNGFHYEALSPLSYYIEIELCCVVLLSSLAGF